jgi:hypothetical protein
MLSTSELASAIINLEPADRELLETTVKLISTAKTQARRNLVKTAIDKLLDVNTLALLETDSNPLLEAKLRGVMAKDALLNYQGQALKSSEVALLLDMTRQNIDKYRLSGQLLGVSLHKRGYRYPLWQFTEGKILPGLAEVLAAMKDISDWGKLLFMVTGDVRLENQTPLQLLQAGEIATVIEAAKVYGQQSAA